MNREDESVLLSKPSISTTAQTLSKPGDYPITVAGASAKNYEVIHRLGKLEIYKAEIIKPQLSNIQMIPDGTKIKFIFKFELQALRRYSVQKSKNLKDWTSDTPPSTPYSEPKTFTAKRTMTDESWFYRVVVHE